MAATLVTQYIIDLGWNHYNRSNPDPKLVGVRDRYVRMNFSGSPGSYYSMYAEIRQDFYLQDSGRYAETTLETLRAVVDFVHDDTRKPRKPLTHEFYILLEGLYKHELSGELASRAIYTMFTEYFLTDPHYAKTLNKYFPEAVRDVVDRQASWTSKRLTKLNSHKEAHKILEELCVQFKLPKEKTREIWKEHEHLIRRNLDMMDKLRDRLERRLTTAITSSIFKAAVKDEENLD